MSQNPHLEMRNLHSQSDGDQTPLPRPPKPETEARLASGEPVAVPAASSALQPPPSKVSQLSATAKEFKPKAVTQPAPHLSVGAAEFVPRTDFVPAPSPNVGPPPPMQMPPMPAFLGPPPPMYMPRPTEEDVSFMNSFNQMNLGGAGGGGGAGTHDSETLKAEFAKVMVILTTHPANIREFLKPLCEKFETVRSPEVLTDVINILYEQSIYEPNFRYTGSRIVHFLCQELRNHAIFGKFKVEFLKKCQQDYMRREQLVKSGEVGMATLCGLTMFMGELFQNVTADASGRTERLDFLPSALTDLLLTLLTVPCEVSIKTTCQLLKMAGGPTEDSMSQKPPQEAQNWHKVFHLLQALYIADLFSQNMKMLIQSVLNLRQNNWGRGDTRSPNPRETTNDTSTPPPQFSPAEPVFYNQYGVPITREEAGYPDDEDDDDYDGYELTEEEERDFLLWQEEGLAMAPPGHVDSSSAQAPFTDGAVYPQWSTADSDYTNSSYQYGDYSHNYDYNSYAPYVEDEGLSDEMERAYEEFLSSQQRPTPNSK